MGSGLTAATSYLHVRELDQPPQTWISSHQTSFTFISNLKIMMTIKQHISLFDDQPSRRLSWEWWSWTRRTEQELIMEFIIAGGLMVSWRCEDTPHSASKTVKVSVKGVDTEQLLRKCPLTNFLWHFPAAALAFTKVDPLTTSKLWFILNIPTIMVKISHSEGTRKPLLFI